MHTDISYFKVVFSAIILIAICKMKPYPSRNTQGIYNLLPRWCSKSHLHPFLPHLLCLSQQLPDHSPVLKHKMHFRTLFFWQEMPFLALLSPYIFPSLFSNILCEISLFLLPLCQSFHLTFLMLLLDQSSPYFSLCCVCVCSSPNHELLKEFGWIEGGTYQVSVNPPFKNHSKWNEGLWSF